MDPNSANQRWSKWKIVVTPGFTRSRDFREFQDNTARFLRKGFGSASQCRIRYSGTRYEIEVLAEGKPAHDPEFVAYYQRSFEKFFTNGFGVGTEVKVSARIMAGSLQDGTPSEQMIMLPSIRLLGED
jgi:hypothetical protein